MRIVIICILLIYSLPNFAQNQFSLGVKTGPTATISSLSGNSLNTDLNPILFSGLNYHIGLNAQYLFQNKFGLESGFNISTKLIKLRQKGLDHIHFTKMDSFSFPFLLLAKLPYPKNPFRKLNFLLGTNIEYQNFINSSENITEEGRTTLFVPNMVVGSRVSFRPGSLGKIDLGVVFDYALKPYYSFSLNDSKNNRELSFSPKSHSLRIEAVYFFLNSIKN